MLTIGLTGGIGSGKSAASAQFEQQGIDIVDADVVSREVVEPGKPALKKIITHFSSDILDTSDELDRGKLRQLIFSDPEQKKWLEALLHPLIRDEIIRQLKASNSPYALLVSPLLFETDQNLLVDRTLLIDVPVELQIKRATKRDNDNTAQIKKIIASQLPREYKIEKTDDIISNEFDLSSLEKAVKQQHQFYLELANEQIFKS